MVEIKIDNGVVDTRMRGNLTVLLEDSLTIVHSLKNSMFRKDTNVGNLFLTALPMILFDSEFDSDSTVEIDLSMLGGKNNERN